jgi:hypothetical protein
MNRLLLLVAALAATVGCDDSTVRDRIDNVLDHGAAQAEVICSGDLTSGSGACGSTLYLFKAALLQDGGSIVQFESRLTGLTSFNTRTSPVDGCGFLPGSGITLCAEAAGGDLTVTSTVFNTCGVGFTSPRVVDLSTCTGFNLEAFD